MAHKKWCGEVCGRCKYGCSLQDSIPCSPDCNLLSKDGSYNIKQCIKVGCGAFRFKQAVNTINSIKKDLPEYYEMLDTLCRRCANILTSQECDVCEDYDMFIEVIKERGTERRQYEKRASDRLETHSNVFKH